jgi:hypothetical protein
MGGGAQNKNRTYQRVPCAWCGKEVASNNMAVHHRVCPQRPVIERSTLGELMELETLVGGKVNAVRLYHECQAKYEHCMPPRNLAKCKQCLGVGDMQGR